MWKLCENRVKNNLMADDRCRTSFPITAGIYTTTNEWSRLKNGLPVLLTFMITNSLHIYGMKALSVNIIGFIQRGRNYSDMCPIGIQTFRTHGRFVPRRFVPNNIFMIKSPFKKIQDVDLKHLKRLVANDVRPKIVYIRRSPRTESSFAS